MTPHPLSTRTAVHAGAGNLPAAYTLLVRNGVLAQLVAILRGAPDNLLTQPARLFAAIVSLSAEGATLATHPSPSLDAAKKAGKGAGPPAEAGACSLLPLVMGRATDGVARAAAAAATGHLVKKDAKARCGGGWGALHGLMGGAHWECALCCRGPSTSTRRKGAPGLTHTHLHARSTDTANNTRLHAQGRAGSGGGRRGPCPRGAGDSAVQPLLCRRLRRSRGRGMPHRVQQGRSGAQRARNAAEARGEEGERGGGGSWLGA